MVLTKEDLQAIENLFKGHFEGIDKRFDRMDKCIDGIDYRLERVESETASLNAGQRAINTQLDKMSKTLKDTYCLALNNWGQIEESKVRLGVLETTQS